MHENTHISCVMTVKAHTNEQHAVEMMKHLWIYGEHNVEPAPPAAPKMREIRLPVGDPVFPPRAESRRHFMRHGPLAGAAD